MSKQVTPNLAAISQRFLAALLREHLRGDTLPPHWTFYQMRDACRALGVSA